MALLFIDSFDHYQSTNILSKWTEGFIAPQLAIGKGRCGTNALVMSTFNQIVKGLTFGSTRMTWGFAVWVRSAYSADTAINFAYAGPANGNHCYLKGNGDGSLEVIYYADGTSLARSAPDLIHFDHWYFIEWQLLVHPTAGEVIVRVNGDVVLSATGVPTANGEVILRKVFFNCPSNHEYYIDDVYVLDSTGPAPLNTFLGDCRVEYLRPRANGNAQQWTPVGTTSHFSAVDDNQTPDDDGTYIESITPGQIDSNFYRPTGLPSGPIFGAQLGLYARKSEIGPRTIAPVANGVVGAPFVGISAETYQYYLTPYGTDPATGLPWTIASINLGEFGVKVNS